MIELSDSCPRCRNRKVIKNIFCVAGQPVKVCEICGETWNYNKETVYVKPKKYIDNENLDISMSSINNK